MRNFLNAALGFIGAAGLVSASDVVELKADTFPAFIKENPLVLAECMFYFDLYSSYSSSLNVSPANSPIN
jgi:hypothetical protein